VLQDTTALRSERPARRPEPGSASHPAMFGGRSPVRRFGQACAKRLAGTGVIRRAAVTLFRWKTLHGSVREDGMQPWTI
jgi:hypothetical protein